MDCVQKNSSRQLSASTNILQPVLQYGTTPAGGGNYWGIASWYVTDFGASHTTVSQVSPNDILYGSMIKVTEPETWIVYFNDTSNSTVPFVSLKVSNTLTVTEPDAYVTLEVYEVRSCKQYPAGEVKFTNLAIEQGNAMPVTPKWLINTYSSACGETVNIISPSEVDISW